MDCLIAKDICKKYGSAAVLSNLSFSVSQGEVFGLLGPNGAGKSTLIKILTGFESKDSGEFSFLFNGKPLSKSEIKKQVSVIPQDLCFYRDFSAKKNLEIMCSLYGIRGKTASQRIDFLIKQWSLEAYKSKRADFLSGGYKRLLNIACGLVNDPKIIFLDEPTVGLDPQIRQVFWEKIIELKKEGKTIILTTHYMDEADHLCDRIFFLIKGQMGPGFSPQFLQERKISLESFFLNETEKQGIKREDI